MMDGTTMALLAGSAAVGAVVGGWAAYAWFGAQRDEIIKKAVVATQAQNRDESDVRIDAIYQAILKRAMEANAQALAGCPSVDVSSAYIDLTALIKRELDGLYDLSEGVFQMVLSIRDSMHETLKVTSRCPPPTGGGTVTWFPNAPENQPAEKSRPSVNEEMKAFIKAFYAFWSQGERRIAEMKRSRDALGLPLASDDKFVDAIVRAAG